MQDTDTHNSPWLVRYSVQDGIKTFAEIDIQFELTEFIILIHNSILQEIYEILRLLVLLFSLSSEFVVFIRATEKYKPRRN